MLQSTQQRIAALALLRQATGLDDATLIYLRSRLSTPLYTIFSFNGEGTVPLVTRLGTAVARTLQQSTYCTV
jgi:hypothetical protein